MTNQHNAAAMTEEQLDAVAGGFDIGPLGSRSIEPNPSHSPMSVAPLPSPHPRPHATKYLTRFQ